MVWLIIVLMQVLFFVELYIAFTLVPVGAFNNIKLIWFGLWSIENILERKQILESCSVSYLQLCRLW